MKKIGIIGAGITGLSAGRFLNKDYDVEILESKSVCGGIARTTDINGVSYHTVGGHCFNSKHQEILDFVFEKVLPISEWNKIKRISKIRLGDHEVMYPIEFSMKEIYDINPTLAIQITSDFLNTTDNGIYSNLKEWFYKKFGKSLSDLYFLPYNAKIWKNNPIKMNPEWVKDKLPIPNKHSFFEGLISTVSDSMPHSSFYYPKSNNQNTFIDALTKGLNVRFETPATSIKYDNKEQKWIVNEVFKYDILINTSPIDLFPALIENVPESVLNASRKLKYNVISNALWESKPTDKTWTYIPDPNFLFHRYIHIGTYFSPTEGFSISESIGNHSYDELFEQGKKDQFLIKPLAYHQSKHAYVVFDENYNDATSEIKKYFNSVGLYSIGRFGEWQYYNMDVCMYQSLKLAEKLKKIL